MSQTIKQPFGATANTLTPTTSVNVGTKADVTTLAVSEQGDAVNHKTVLTLTDFAVGSATGAAALGFGSLIYTLPAGAQLSTILYMSVALTGTTTIVADTPDFGVGSVIATGVVSVLGGTATFEDYLTGQTSGAISGSNVKTAMTGATAGIHTGIALNASGSTKTLFLNCADTWAGTGDVTATGTITLIWRMVS